MAAGGTAVVVELDVYHGIGFVSIGGHDLTSLDYSIDRIFSSCSCGCLLVFLFMETTPLSSFHNAEIL